ncbi:MAG TPA: hypothetical protein VFX17_00770 [Patescibacteria group bacterium]|nr:hypothetical protein [Patescibacteria group bacterium]
MDTQNPGQMPASSPETPNPEPAKNWFAAHKALVIIIVVAVLAAAGASAYFIMTSKVSPIALQPVVHQEKADTSAKVYTNSKYGFEFSYPGKYFLASPLIEQPNGQLDFDAQTKQLNSGLPENAEFLNVETQDYAELKPAVSCSAGELCEASQTDFNSNIKIINNAQLGDTVNMQQINGTVVSIGGQKGLRTNYFNPTGGDWDLAVILYDKNKNQIWLSFSIPAASKEEALASAEYKDMTSIISTFKFTN